MGDKGWRRKGGRRSHTMMEGGKERRGKRGCCTKIIHPTSVTEKRDGFV